MRKNNRDVVTATGLSAAGGIVFLLVLVGIVISFCTVIMLLPAFVIWVLGNLFIWTFGLGYSFSFLQALVIILILTILRTLSIIE